MNIEQSSELPIVTLIQKIKEGSIDSSTISKEMRIKCVEVLWLEAYKPSEMTQIFKCSDKTIKRDLNEIREINAISPNIELAKKIIGEFFLKAQNSHLYLSKLARSKESSISEKVQAEYSAHLVMSDTVTKLQSLGYLPTVTQNIVGNIFYHYNSEDTTALIGEIKTLQEICPNSKELNILEAKAEEIIAKKANEDNKNGEQRI